jgi:hypothetical protein
MSTSASADSAAAVKQIETCRGSVFPDVQMPEPMACRAGALPATRFQR